MSGDIDQQQWHEVLSERNNLRHDWEELATAVRKHHDEQHPGAARWCDVPPCRLLFRAGS
ncbi:hypothetical protein [Nocardia otitidiscaviarum]|uniref:hypothetical protein n=1 Tax=Nocardia otitidiscaviarum TaxID=1823 RepID=UPI002453C459|nr:hypothetical protein [Nocardia otitidiscaviarum]